MIKRFLPLALACALSSPAWAASPVSLVDPTNTAVGTATNPLVVTGGGGGGGGGGNVAATPNGTDGQATSNTNQQNVVYNYVFNGTTWDRVRGTGGFIGTFLSSPLPTGTNMIGGVTQSGTWSVGTTNGALESGGNLAALLARTPALGPTTRANAQPVTIATDQPAVPVTPNACTITQTVVTLAANTSTQLVAANAARKSLSWMDVGTNPFTAAPGASAAVVGQGINYSGASAAGQQGGSEAFAGPAVATNAFQAISAAGATVVVWDCN